MQISMQSQHCWRPGNNSFEFVGVRSGSAFYTPSPPDFRVLDLEQEQKGTRLSADYQSNDRLNIAAAATRSTATALVNGRGVTVQARAIPIPS